MMGLRHASTTELVEQEIRSARARPRVQIDQAAPQRLSGDSLTRWDLQEVLMEVWARSRVTAIMVTHDVDEAILLADRVVMMGNGLRAKIGRVMDVPLERPRSRETLLNHSRYYELREELIGFLEDCGRQH